MTSLQDSRQLLRKALRQARRDLPLHEQTTAAKALVECFHNNVSQLLEDFLSIKSVALYLANDGEISPECLCEYFWERNIETYLPVIKGQQLDFALYTENSQWQNNQYGIKEPTSTKRISSDDLDLVFLPLVGFDKKGGRLGMGGGFYDRTFANKKTNSKPYLIGLAHNCQEVDTLPIASWDVPLQAIMTPSSPFGV